MPPRKSKDPSKRSTKSKRMRPRKKLLPVEDAGRLPPAPLQQAMPLFLPLERATFINEVTFRSIEGQSTKLGRYVGPVGERDENKNKFLVTELWSDGYFVYILSDKYRPMAVPCSNVLYVEPLYNVADAEVTASTDQEVFVGQEPEKEELAQLAEDHAVSLSEASAGAPPEEVTTEVVGPDQALPHRVLDPSAFLPNDSVASWLQGELQDKEPGEYIVVNYNTDTSYARLQARDLTIFPFRIPESLL